MDQKMNWSFKLYDHRKTGKITYNDMLEVVAATYKMIGPMVSLPDDEKTPDARTTKFFTLLDKNPETDTINLDEFKRLLKLDPSIANSINAYEGLV